jgi:hypothetical protein
MGIRWRRGLLLPVDEDSYHTDLRSTLGGLDLNNGVSTLALLVVAAEAHWSIACITRSRETVDAPQDCRRDLVELHAFSPVVDLGRGEVVLSSFPDHASVARRHRLSKCLKIELVAFKPNSHGHTTSVGINELLPHPVSPRGHDAAGTQSYGLVGQQFI